MHAMANDETHVDSVEQSGTPGMVPPELAAMGRKRLDELAAAQAQQLEKLRELNRNWFDRMQSEAAMASELAGKLTAARSVPEVATAYQDWATQHMERAAEDAKHILAEAQKLAESGVQLLSRGFQGNGHGASS
jgi:hypothetical protein